VTFQRSPFALQAAAFASLAFAAVAMTTGPADAKSALTPTSVAANPSTYDGKPIKVAGTVAKYQTQSTMRGKVAGYHLCDAKCIVVIDFKGASHANGASVTASGTFHATYKTPRGVTYTNALVIGG
jgi:cytochrome c-type biogenesis protein CcmE